MVMVDNKITEITPGTGSLVLKPSMHLRVLPPLFHRDGAELGGVNVRSTAYTHFGSFTFPRKWHCCYTWSHGGILRLCGTGFEEPIAPLPLGHRYSRAGVRPIERREFGPWTTRAV